MDEGVVLAFVADVEKAVGELRQLVLSSQEVADTSKAAADGVASVTGPANAAAEASARLAEANDEAAASAERVATASRAAGDAAVTSAGKADEAAAATSRWRKSIGVAVLGMAVAAGASVMMAGNFQDATTHLVTDAGESAKNLAMVQQGILQVSTATGQSAGNITNAMYHIESGGFHAAQGLALLKVAAEGARVGGADLDTVGKSLVGTMNAYGMSSANAATQQKMAVTMMNELITTVAQGDMRMQDLASSLGNVVPVAASAKLSFAQVGGALATMTAQNMTAQQATQDLRHTIVSLENPNAVAKKEMAALGLSASDLSSHLGQRGLTGTIAMVAAAAHAHAGALGQTYTQALAKAAGGTTGLTVALMLSGQRMGAFGGNVAAIAAEARKGGMTVDNWSKIQGTFNFRLDQAKEGAKNAAISFGTALLPAATQLMGVIAGLGMWFSQNAWAAAALAAVIAGVLSVVIGGKMITSVREGIQAFRELKDAQLVQAAASRIAAAAQWLLNAAMDANPVMIIVLAVIALIAIFVLLWTHCAAFRKFWEDVWHDILFIVDHAISWIRGHWPLLLAILTGPVGLAALFIIRHWHQIVDGAERMFHDVVSFFEQLPHRIMAAVNGFDMLLWNAGVSVIRGLINGITSMASSAVSAVTNIGSSIIGGFKSMLGIGSPSRVFYEHGRNTLLGYIQGLQAVAPQVLAAMHGLGGQVASGGIGIGATGGGAYGGPPSVHVNMPVTLQGTAQLYNTPQFYQYLQGAVQEAVLRYATLNPGNGLSPAWRLG